MPTASSSTRREVREGFYTELETAVSGFVPASNIRQEYPNTAEQLPAVVHVDDYTDVPMNRGAAPVDVGTDSDGEQTYYYARQREARFGLLVLAADEQTKEDAYEALYTHFQRYETPAADESSIAAGVHDVDVQDVSSEDARNRDPPARGDRLAVYVQFQRLVANDVDPTKNVVQNFDVNDDDENTDFTTETT